MAYSDADYQRERAICDTAHAYAERIMNGRRNYLTVEEAKAPEYAACDNAMRGRVEQFEILRDVPDLIFAYLASDVPDGLGDRLDVTVWTCDKIGSAVVHTVGRQRSWRQRYGRAKIAGHEYSWQGEGAGMYARFRKLKGAK